MSESGSSGGPEPPRPPAPQYSKADLGRIITRNAVFALIGRLGVVIGWALIAPYMLQVLGEDRFAIWALLFALSGYFLAFDLGLSQGIVKFVAEYTAIGERRPVRGVVTFATIVYLLMTVVAVVGLGAFKTPVLQAIHTPPELYAEAGWCLIGMALVFGTANLVGILSSVLMGHQRHDLVYRISLLVTLLQLVGVVVVLHLGWGLRGLVVNAGVGMALIGLLSLRAVAGVEPDLRLEVGALKRDLLRRMAHFSAVLQVANVGGFLQFQLDKVLLAHFISLSLVSKFELSFRLSSAVWQVPLLPIAPLMPAVSHLGSVDDRDGIKRLYRRASRYVFAVAFPLAGFAIACAPGIVTAWLGTGYRDVVIATSGMVLFLLMQVLTAAGTAVSRGIGKPWMEARYHLVGTAVHVVLSLWLVPRWGLYGVLTALCVSGVVAVTYFVRHFHSYMEESTTRWLKETVMVPLLASAAATAVVMVLRGGEWAVMPASRSEAWAQVAQGGAVYVFLVGASYFLSRFLTLQEIKQMARGLLRPRAGAGQGSGDGA